jgi:hypothetical protein
MRNVRKCEIKILQHSDGQQYITHRPRIKKKTLGNVTNHQILSEATAGKSSCSFCGVSGYKTTIPDFRHTTLSLPK